MYRFKGWEDSHFIRITAIGETLILGVQENGKEDTFLKYKDWLPYEPKEEPKPLETWTKTMDLRVRIRNGIMIGGTHVQDKILQQKHVSNLCNEKWVDVESVTI